MKQAFIGILAGTVGILLSSCGGTTAREEITETEIRQEERVQRNIADTIAYTKSSVTIKNVHHRLYGISLPLAVAAAPFCKYKQRAIGFAPELRKYGVYIDFTVPNTPAARHLQIRDRITHLNGFVINDNASFGKVFVREVSKGDVTLTVERAGETLEIPMSPFTKCATNTRYDPSSDPNAYVDGNGIVVVNGGLTGVLSDEELAVVIAHEIAHHSKRHVRKTQGNEIGGQALGIGTNILVKALVFGMTGMTPPRSIQQDREFEAAAGRALAHSYSQEFEFEADYVGLYIMARAGMDITTAPNIWRKFAKLFPESIERSVANTHPSSPERYVGLKKTVEEIKQKIANGEELIPNPK